MFHRATFDYMDLGERSGNRAVGIGEVPYFDPESISKAESLRLKKAEANGDTNGTANGAPETASKEGHGMAMGDSKKAAGGNGVALKPCCMPKGGPAMAH
jgi:hypothetical protein